VGYAVEQSFEALLVRFPRGKLEFFFQLFNPSDLTMAVGSTQPLTQMRTRIRLQLKYDGTRGHRERK